MEAATPSASGSQRLSESDAVCIAYVDHVAASGLSPAQALTEFFNRYLDGCFNRVHILPHFPSPKRFPDQKGAPSRADGGFEACSYEMDPAYGSPADLREMRAGLMFDFVLNHLSVESEWFKRFLAADPEFADFFLTIPPERCADLDLSGVFRPRTHHPVVEFEAADGSKRHVWCTFSKGQADLNFKNPEVFCRIVEATLKDMLGQGANWVRLDAVGYLVKMLGLEASEPKSSCFGIEETHAIIKALRALLEELCPSATLIAEVNGRKEAIDSYYGDGDEAHLAYAFPCPPLSLFATYTGDAGPLIDWAKQLAAAPDRTNFAFTASHDGVGVLPMEDCPALPDGTSATSYLVDQARQRGAGINFKKAFVDGQPREVPYEICTTWLQAVMTPAELEAVRSDRLTQAQVADIAQRFAASISYELVAPHSVPAIYLGALAGLLNDDTTSVATGSSRDKNRGQIDLEALPARWRTHAPRVSGWCAPSSRHSGQCWRHVGRARPSHRRRAA